MIYNFSKKSKLIPIFFSLLLIAFIIHVGNVKRGFDLLITPAFAAEPIPPTITQDSEEPDSDKDSIKRKVVSQPIAEDVEDEEIHSSNIDDILVQFREQRDKLNAREKVLYDLQAQMFNAAEKKINDRVIELKAVEKELRKLLSLYSETEEKQLQRIVKMYESMKAKSAAPRFEVLELPVQIDIAMRMKEKNMAAIMEAMSVQKSNILTTELATRDETPTIDEINESLQGG